MSRFKWLTLALPAFQIAVMMGGLLLVSRVVSAGPMACLDNLQTESTPAISISRSEKTPAAPCLQDENIHAARLSSSGFQLYRRLKQATTELAFGLAQPVHR